MKIKIPQNFLVVLVLFNLLITNALAADTDNDGIDDTKDNCLNIPNHEQRDTDGDGYGNKCDGDLNADCGVVNLFDLGILRDQFNTSSINTDFNSDGDIDFLDFFIFKQLLNVEVYLLSNIGNCPAPAPPVP